MSFIKANWNNILFKPPKFTVAVILASIFLVEIILVHSTDSGHETIHVALAQGPQGGNYTFGQLSSIQNDENGNPFWIVSGNWRTNLLDFADQSQTTDQGNLSSQGSSPVFNTSVRMINFNGTGEHTHSITDFALENVTMRDNMTAVFKGIATANFREGPITDIPTIITITDGKVISLWLDPSRINNHYGDTPVYGMVLREKR